MRLSIVRSSFLSGLAGVVSLGACAVDPELGEALYWTKSTAVSDVEFEIAPYKSGTDEALSSPTIQPGATLQFMLDQTSDGLFAMISGGPLKSATEGYSDPSPVAYQYTDDSVQLVDEALDGIVEPGLLCADDVYAFAADQFLDAEMTLELFNEAGDPSTTLYFVDTASASLRLVMPELRVTGKAIKESGQAGPAGALLTDDACYEKIGLFFSVPKVDLVFTADIQVDFSPDEEPADG